MVLCTCPACGNSWAYKGKAKPGQYVCCPACSNRFKRPIKTVVHEDKTGLAGRCQRCGEPCDDLHLVQLDDGEVVLACEKCVEAGRF